MRHSSASWNPLTPTTDSAYATDTAYLDCGGSPPLFPRRLASVAPPKPVPRCGQISCGLGSAAPCPPREDSARHEAHVKSKLPDPRPGYARLVMQWLRHGSGALPRHPLRAVGGIHPVPRRRPICLCRWRPFRDCATSVGRVAGPGSPPQRRRSAWTAEWVSGDYHLCTYSKYYFKTITPMLLSTSSTINR